MMLKGLLVTIAALATGMVQPDLASVLDASKAAFNSGDGDRMLELVLQGDAPDAGFCLGIVMLTKGDPDVAIAI